MSNEGRKRARRKALLTNRMKRKLALLFTIIVLALIGVNVRLAYINKTNGDKYTKRVLAQQGHEQHAASLQTGRYSGPERDDSGHQRKGIQPDSGPEGALPERDEEDPDKDCVEPTLQALVQYFGLDEAELRATYNDRIDSSYVVLLRQLTKDEISEFEALMEDDEPERGSRASGLRIPISGVIPMIPWPVM